MSQPSLGFVGGADGPVTVFASDGGTALLIYLALINLVTFFVYGADKRRARQGKWRVPEKTLFLLPLLGGSVGALLGMLVFRMNRDEDEHRKKQERKALVKEYKKQQKLAKNGGLGA